MRPLLADLLDEFDAFGEAVALLIADGWVIGETELEFDGGYDSGAVAQQGVRDEEGFFFKVVDEVDDPGCVGGDQVGGMLEEDLGNGASERA